MKFIGMDAHSQTCTFVVLGKSGKVLQKATVKTQEDRLLAVVRSIKGRKKLAFEEGVMAQWLYLLLKDEVEELVVCCPTERKSGPKQYKPDVLAERSDAVCACEIGRTAREHQPWRVRWSFFS